MTVRSISYLDRTRGRLPIQTGAPAPTVMVLKTPKPVVSFFRKLKAVFSSTTFMVNTTLKVADSHLKSALKAEGVGGFLDAAKSYQKAAETIVEAYSMESSPKLKKAAESLFYSAIINYTKRLQLFELSSGSQIQLCRELSECYAKLGLKTLAVQYRDEAVSLESTVKSNVVQLTSTSVTKTPSADKKEVCSRLSVCYSSVGLKEASDRYAAKAIEPEDSWEGFGKEPADKVGLAA